MHKFKRDMDHKLRVLQRADKIGDVDKLPVFWRWSGQFLSLADRLSAAA